MQATGGELDSFFKQYCNFEPDEHKTIAHYASFILSEYPDIKEQSITVIGTDLNIVPFANWNQKQANQSLFWWAAYNNVKHNRYMCKSDASQKNILHILGALYLIEMKYLKKITAGLEQPYHLARKSHFMATLLLLNQHKVKISTHLKQREWIKRMSLIGQPATVRNTKTKIGRCVRKSWTQRPKTALRGKKLRHETRCKPAEHQNQQTKKTRGKPASPYFQWQRGWDSNPRWLLTTLDFESSTFDHSDTSPCSLRTKILYHMLLAIVKISQAIKGNLYR